MYSDQEKYNFKTFTILKQIVPAIGTQPIELINPNWVIAGTNENADYSVFVTCLYAVVRLRSVGQTVIPPIPNNASPEEVSKILEEVSRLTQFKKLKIMSGFEGSTPMELWQIPMFNQDPGYIFSLMPFYCGNNNTIDVGTDFNNRGEILSIQMFDALGVGDSVTIRGSAIRRASKRLEDLNREIIYSVYDRNITATESVALATNNRRAVATFVNYTYMPDIDPVTQTYPDPLNYTVWLKRGNGRGLPVGPGQTAKITKDDMYRGDVRAVSNRPCYLVAEEGVWNA